MRFEAFIARRYLMSGRHKMLLSAITAICVAGVAAGVFALVVVTAVMDGFDADLAGKMIGANSHIQIAQASPDLHGIDSSHTLDAVRSVPGVAGASAFISGQALLRVGQEGGRHVSYGLVVKGTDLDEAVRPGGLPRITSGTAPLGPSDILLRRHTEDSTAALPVGNRVQAVSEAYVETPTGIVFVMRDLRIAGYYETDNHEMAWLGFMSLEGARDLFHVPEGAVHGVDVMVSDRRNVESIRQSLRARLGPDYEVLTWEEQNPVYRDLLRLEKWSMLFVLLLVVIVAAFNIVGTLLMTVMDKTREIGALKAMGATQRSTGRIFVLQSLIVGGLGTALGASGGSVVCYVLQHHMKISIRSQFADYIPVQMNWWVNAAIVAVSLAVCIAASLYPARHAAQLDAVEAMR